MSPSVNRRKFLGVAATAAGAAAAAGAAPSALAQALAAPVTAGSGTINDVEHVVIFMQENRAFDHYYGSMRGVRGFGDRNKITLPSGKSVLHQPYSNSEMGLGSAPIYVLNGQLVLSDGAHPQKVAWISDPTYTGPGQDPRGPDRWQRSAPAWWS